MVKTSILARRGENGRRGHPKQRGKSTPEQGGAKGGARASPISATHAPLVRHPCATRAPPFGRSIHSRRFPVDTFPVSLWCRRSCRFFSRSMRRCEGGASRRMVARIWRHSAGIRLDAASHRSYDPRSAEKPRLQGRMPMLFCSQDYLVFFLCVFAAYWAIPWHRVRVWLLLGASFYFYASFSHWLALVIAASSFLRYSMGRGSDSFASPRWRKTLLFASLAGNLGLLVYFKYVNFFLSSFQSALQAMGASRSIRSEERRVGKECRSRWSPY